MSAARGRCCMGPLLLLCLLQFAISTLALTSLQTRLLQVLKDYPETAPQCADCEEGGAYKGSFIPRSLHMRTWSLFYKGFLCAAQALCTDGKCGRYLNRGQIVYWSTCRGPQSRDARMATGCYSTSAWMGVRYVWLLQYECLDGCQVRMAATVRVLGWVSGTYGCYSTSAWMGVRYVWLLQYECLDGCQVRMAATVRVLGWVSGTYGCYSTSA